MNFTLVPFLVFLVAAVLMLHMRLGRDAMVPVFLAPWYAFEPDIGVSITVAQLLFILLAAKYLLKTRLKHSAIPDAGLLSAIAGIGVYSALVTFFTYDIDSAFAGGPLRNGWLRTFVILVKFFIYLLPFAILNSAPEKMPFKSILRALIYSIAILSALGILQVIVFILTSTDIFPIGMFIDKPRSAYVVIQQQTILRAASFSGEPKGLGMMASAGVVLLLAFGSSAIESRISRYALFTIFTLTVILTQSTSALLSLAVGVTVIFGLKAHRRPLSRRAILVLFFSTATALTVLFFYNANSFEMRSGITFGDPNASFIELIYQRTLGRLRVDDFDWVIIKSMIHEPSSIIIGRGFGLAHLFTDPFIPPSMRRYMEGAILAPKSGLILFISNGGILATILFVLFLARTTPAVGRKTRAADPAYAESVRKMQAALIPLVVMTFMREQVFEIFMITLALVTCQLLARKTLQKQNDSSKRYSAGSSYSVPQILRKGSP